MRKMVEKIFTGYGKDLILRTASGEQPVRAFLQPVTGKAERYGLPEPTVLGFADPGQYVYIGPVRPVARVGDELADGETGFVFRNVQVLDYAGEPLYTWGVCVRKEGFDL